MITLFPSPDCSSRFRPGRTPKHAQHSKDIDISQMTIAQARAEAKRIMSLGLSQLTWRGLDLLAVGGALDAGRLGVSERTLRAWTYGRLVDRIPVDEKELRSYSAELGLPIRPR